MWERMYIFVQIRSSGNAKIKSSGAKTSKSEVIRLLHLANYSLKEIISVYVFLNVIFLSVKKIVIKVP